MRKRRIGPKGTFIDKNIDVMRERKKGIEEERTSRRHIHIWRKKEKERKPAPSPKTYLA